MYWLFDEMKLIQNTKITRIKDELKKLKTVSYLRVTGT